MILGPPPEEMVILYSYIYQGIWLYYYWCCHAQYMPFLASKKFFFCQFPSVYEALNEPKMNIYPASSIILDSILSDGQFYDVWDGKVKCDATPPLRVVIKKIQGNIFSNVLIKKQWSFHIINYVVTLCTPWTKQDRSHNIVAHHKCKRNWFSDIIVTDGHLFDIQEFYWRLKW